MTAVDATGNESARSAPFRVYLQGAGIAAWNLSIPFPNPSRAGSSVTLPIEIPAGELFVLGDNRAHSGDSRFAPPSGFGLVPEGKVIGRAFVIVWPPSEWDGVSR